MNGQLTYWEKISNHTSRIHREFSVQLSKTTGNPTEKTEKQMGKDMSRHFTKEHTGIDMKHMRRGSTPLVTGKLQITTTVRHHYPSTRIAINSKTDDTKGFEDVTKLAYPLPDPLARMYSHSGKVCQFLKRLDKELPCGNTCPHKSLYINVHSGTICNCLKVKTIQVSTT